MCESCVDINAVVGREDGYNDHIKRGDLLVAYDKANKGPPGVARKLIQEAPAEDVVPVVHGRWIFDGDQWDFRCTNCRMWQGTNMKKYRYCPNCGAKMDGG